MASRYQKIFLCPSNFHEILHDFAFEVIRCQPADIVQFGAEYFETVAEGKAFVHQSKYLEYSEADM